MRLPIQISRKAQIAISYHTHVSPTTTLVIARDNTCSKGEFPIEGGVGVHLTNSGRCHERAVHPEGGS